MRTALTLEGKSVIERNCRACDAVPLAREAGASFNESSRYCESQPLHVCRSSNAEALRHLHPKIVREHFRAAATGEPVLLLHVAARENRSECIQALAEYGADATATTTNGDNALHIVAARGFSNCLEIMVSLMPPTLKVKPLCTREAVRE
ncbi:ankyrin repeat domain-containing protein [Endozoicomonas sp. ONNA2]|uniref:ankyrin repeat domain-containing protein n=1 Tax=Endozoicomonas sp. ONNA2 TaxID=2828741 RepID=UPI00214773EB|nr:ankyrin repeat domain-containing protein [Endozoicomonas sp. ONNA2]